MNQSIVIDPGSGAGLSGTGIFPKKEDQSDRERAVFFSVFVY